MAKDSGQSRARTTTGVGALGIAALLWGCSAGGSRVGVPAEGTAPADVPPPRGAVPELDAPPPLSAETMAPTTADFIGDSEVPVSSMPTTARRRGLTQRQVSCNGGGTTSVSGTVYIPSG